MNSGRRKRTPAWGPHLLGHTSLTRRLVVKFHPSKSRRISRQKCYSPHFDFGAASQNMTFTGKSSWSRPGGLIDATRSLISPSPPPHVRETPPRFELGPLVFSPVLQPTTPRGLCYDSVFYLIRTWIWNHQKTENPTPDPAVTVWIFWWIRKLIFGVSIVMSTTIHWMHRTSAVELIRNTSPHAMVAWKWVKLNYRATRYADPSI